MTAAKPGMTLANPGIQAVILSGGGAFAAYEAGAMKAIFSGASAGTGYTPMEPAIFTGTSAGAYNAAFMASQPDSDSISTVERLEYTWLNEFTNESQKCGNRVYRIRGSPLPYLNPECLTAHPTKPLASLAEDTAFFAQDWFKRGVNFLLSSGGIGQRTLALVDLSTLISNHPFAQLIKDTIHLDGIRRSDKVLRVASTNWKVGHLRLFSNEDMTEELGHLSILSSTALPGIFSPVYVAGEPYVDGGVVMNTPLLPAIELGADTIHVIYLDPDVKNIPLRRLQNSLDVIDRLRVIMFALTVNKDIETARSINKGLDILGRIGRGEVALDSEIRSFIASAALIEERIKTRAPYKMLTIHRYHPKDELGGTLGVLNFDRRLIQAYLDRGFNDAAEHNCFSSDCMVPLLDKF